MSKSGSRWERKLLLGGLAVVGAASCVGGIEDSHEISTLAENGAAAEVIGPEAITTIVVNTSGDEAILGRCSLREAIQAANTGAVAGGCAAGDPLGTALELNTDVLLTQDRNIAISGSLQLFTTLSHRPQITGRASAIVVSPTGVLKVRRIRFSGFTTTSIFVDSLGPQRGKVEMIDSELSDNHGPIAGAQTVGILNNGGYVSLIGCLLQRNTDSIKGGALLNSGGVVEISKSSITENAAWQSGGGIHNSSNGTLRISDSTISGNRQASDSNGGGGIFNASGSVHLDFCTIVNNSTRVDGSGVKNIGGVIQAKRSIIAGNFVIGPFAGTGMDCEGTVSSGGFNLHGDCAAWVTATGDKEVGDPRLEPLSQQSGWLTRYSKLKPDSPANAAIPLGQWCPSSTLEDQLGQRRPAGFACEMGAIELD